MKKILIVLLIALAMGCTKQDKPQDDLPQETAAAGCAITSECKTSEEEIENYESLLASDTFKHTSLEESIDLFENKESGILFYGFKTCPWCQDAIDYIKEEADKANKNVYYINVRVDGDTSEFDLRNEENESYLKLQELLKDHMLDETNKIYVPAVLVLKDGEVESIHYSTVESYDPKEREMNQEEIHSLKAIYKEMFNK